MNNWLRPSIQIPRYIALMVKAMFKPTIDTQEAIKEYWDTWNKVYDPPLSKTKESEDEQTGQLRQA